MSDIHDVLHEWDRRNDTENGSDAPADVAEVKEALECICVPCEFPQRGTPGIAHCAACCAGSLIEVYDHHCPVAEHQVMAVRQFGPLVAAVGVEKEEL